MTQSHNTRPLPTTHRPQPCSHTRDTHSALITHTPNNPPTLLSQQTPLAPALHATHQTQTHTHAPTPPPRPSGRTPYTRRPLSAHCLARDAGARATPAARTGNPHSPPNSAPHSPSTHCPTRRHSPPFAPLPTPAPPRGLSHSQTQASTSGPSPAFFATGPRPGKASTPTRPGPLTLALHTFSGEHGGSAATPRTPNYRFPGPPGLQDYHQTHSGCRDAGMHGCRAARTYPGVGEWVGALHPDTLLGTARRASGRASEHPVTLDGARTGLALSRTPTRTTLSCQISPGLD
ncbi:translation initiation factor IF-2-like [Onychomys torridus]|uniref:translation initiation factor IF-2-like n=1 Tax=Onychomys torridus TaxID=38674 RepID=UPI00167F3FF9|nr:translation initiation factor IF-2-like [Onychomys torridus]XP_036032089.1 translation initiation factor IF-2-like [Onychomys torridus]XP_036032090.1 translation initiation factor IF-2-like [Onychomys torridus]